MYRIQRDVRLAGVADRTLRWVEENQLLDPAMWARFVRQFRIHPDSADNGWRGEYWGKMMRGAVMVYQYTHNEELFCVLTDTVKDLLRAQNPDGSFSTYLPGKAFCHWDMWCRKYVMLGMEHYLEICADEALKENILKALCAHMDAILAHVGAKEEGKTPITETSGIYGGMNSVSILEPVVRLWKLTEKEEYHRFAEHILSTGGSRNINIFELAYRDESDPYTYGQNKAYEMMSCFEGLVEYYEATGDEFCRDAAIRFGRRVMSSDVTVIGCCGTLAELFDHSAVRQTERPDGVLQETCVTVTWMKLCRRLFAITGDPAFLDAVEQSYYNAYLSTLNTSCCHASNERLRFLDDAVQTLLPFDSYSPLIPGIRGEETGGAQRLDDGTYYGCCAAIASAGAAIFPQSMLWQKENDILLALYESGEAVCKLPSGQRLNIRVHTDYPASGSIFVELQPEHPEVFGLCLRIPEWSEYTALTVNGEARNTQPGIFREEREWKAGDRLELTLDFGVILTQAPVYGKETLYSINWQNGEMVPFTIEQSPEARNFVTLRQGPIALATDRRLGRDPERAVRVTARSGERVAFEPVAASDIPYPCMTACRIALPEESLLLTDYASTGRLWSRESESAVWLPAEFERNGEKTHEQADG